MASEFLQAEEGVVIGLGIILTLQFIGMALNNRERKAARARYEQELRDHPPSTATYDLKTLSGHGTFTEDDIKAKMKGKQ